MLEVKIKHPGYLNSPKHLVNCPVQGKVDKQRVEEERTRLLHDGNLGGGNMGGKELEAEEQKESCEQKPPSPVALTSSFT